MSNLVGRLVLASGSPRRKEILTTLNIPFSVLVSDVPEFPVPGEMPRAYSARLALEKAAAVCERIAAEDGVVWVLAADTIVVLGDLLLEKPLHYEDNVRMLRELSGRTHHVVTAVSVAMVHSGKSTPRGARQVESSVLMRSLTEHEIHAYVASGEGLDKAGGYAVQGLASGFVPRVEGSYSNVVGLPATETVQLLSEAGALLAWP